MGSSEAWQDRQDEKQAHMARLIRECQDHAKEDSTFEVRLTEALKNG